jgi:hypothetical protein
MIRGVDGFLYQQYAESATPRIAVRWEAIFGYEYLREFEPKIEYVIAIVQGTCAFKYPYEIESGSGCRTRFLLPKSRKSFAFEKKIWKLKKNICLHYFFSVKYFQVPGEENNLLLLSFHCVCGPLFLYVSGLLFIYISSPLFYVSGPSFLCVSVSLCLSGLQFLRLCPTVSLYSGPLLLCVSGSLFLCVSGPLFLCFSCLLFLCL